MSCANSVGLCCRATPATRIGDRRLRGGDGQSRGRRDDHRLPPTYRRPPFCGGPHYRRIAPRSRPRYRLLATAEAFAILVDVVQAVFENLALGSVGRGFQAFAQLVLPVPQFLTAGTALV